MNTSSGASPNAAIPAAWSSSGAPCPVCARRSGSHFCVSRLFPASRRKLEREIEQIQEAISVCRPLDLETSIADLRTLVTQSVMTVKEFLANAGESDLPRARVHSDSEDFAQPVG